MSEVCQILRRVRPTALPHPSSCARSDETQESGLQGSETGQPRLAAVEQANQSPHAHGEQPSRVALVDRSRFRSGRSGEDDNSRRWRCSYDHIVVDANARGARKW